MRILKLLTPGSFKQSEAIFYSTHLDPVLTLMAFKLLLCLSSPNFPSDFAVLFLTQKYY